MELNIIPQLNTGVFWYVFTTHNFIWFVITSLIMGRRSLADKLLEPYLEEEPGEDTWLILYDFHGTKTTTKFYDNPKRIQTQTEGKLIQYSAYMTNDQRAAKAIRDLVHHYQGEATLFKGHLIDL
jgi:hypothetical protein